MQGEIEREGGRDGTSSSPDRRCTSSADGMPGCSTVLIDSPIKSTCRRSPLALGARSGDGKTRRYVRSSEPRLKWTEELHQCFLRATAKLGGPEKATPKAILQEMNVRWLKIAHVKSHLQMYRNPKSGKSFSPRSDFTFQLAEPEPSAEVWNNSNHAIVDKDYHVFNSTAQAGNRHHVQEILSDSVEAASWRSVPLQSRPGSVIQHPTVTNVDVSTATREHTYSFVCSDQSPAQLTQMGHFGNIVLSQTSDHIGDESRVGADFFKMAEVLMESRPSKSRDFEITSDDVDIDRRQTYFLSDQMLADADSAEALAHNLLMAMRERKLLEAAGTGTQTPHLGPHETHDRDDAIVLPETVPLELTMSVGRAAVPDPNPNVSPMIYQSVRVGHGTSHRPASPQSCGQSWPQACIVGTDHVLTYAAPTMVDKRVKIDPTFTSLRV